MTLKEIQDEVIRKYRVKINTYSDCWGRMHAHVKTRTVCKWKPASSLKATFDLFHEIGHIETTKAEHRRCEAEYYATVFAINLFQEYGLEIPEHTFKEYQDYIFMELDRGLRRHGSNLPTRTQMTLPRRIDKAVYTSYTPGKGETPMPESEKKKASHAKWDAANTRQVKIKLNLRTDADILDKLDRTENVQGYIKRLIRDDMKGEGD